MFMFIYLCFCLWEFRCVTNENRANFRMVKRIPRTIKNFVIYKINAVTKIFSSIYKTTDDVYCKIVAENCKSACCRNA